MVLGFIWIPAISAGNSFEEGIAGFIAEMGDAVFSTPNKEVGKNVFACFFLFNYLPRESCFRMEPC